MPYKSIAEAKKAGFAIVLDNIALTLLQVNLIAQAFDSVKAKGGVANPMAVAVASFKKVYKIDNGKWVRQENMSDDYLDVDIITLATDDKKTFSVDGLEILKPGDYQGRVVTSKMIDQMIEAFYAIGKKIPLKLGHAAKQKLLQEDGYPAAGYLRTLRKVGEVLLCDLTDVPKKIKELIDLKAYAQRSCEFYKNFQENGVTYPIFLAAVALLGGEVPAVSNLNDFRELYNGLNYDGVENIFLSAKDGNLEEIKFKKEEKQMDEKEAKKIQEENDKLKADAKAKDDENVKLKADAKVKDDEQIALAAANKKKDITSFIDSMIEKGKVLPANKESTIATMLAIDETKKIILKVEGKDQEVTALEAFKKSVESLPDVVKLAEKSKDGKAEQFSTEEMEKTNPELGDEGPQKLHKLALKIQSDEKTEVVAGKEVPMTYDTAVLKASAQKPDWSKAERAK